MPEAYYIIPMVPGPYGVFPNLTVNMKRPEYVDEIRCNWTGHPIDELGVYVCLVNTSESKHDDLSGRAGVRQLPRGYTWDTPLSSLPVNARNIISNWCSGKGIPYDDTETIGELLMRIISSGLFSFGATALSVNYGSLAQDQKDKIVATCHRWGWAVPEDAETVRQVASRLGRRAWPGNDRTVVMVEEF